MKQYFTKYLPVEGEIKEGDKIFLNKKLDTASLSENTFMEDYNDNPECKLAKLFLCSRGVPEYYNNPHVDFYDGMKEEDRFYKIGEISPDALSYLSEGQEFEDDQICAIFPVDYEADEFIPIQEVDEFIKKENLHRSKGYEYDPLKLLYAIKGPCSHFH